MNPLLKQGLAAHEQGKLAQAEQCYRGVLQQEPQNADALHLLGVIAFQARRFEPAADLISRAITINPNAAMYQNNLGNVLRALLRRQEAETCYRRAVQLQPSYADAQTNLGTVLRDQAKFAAAVEAYERAAQVNPSLPEAHGNLGTALKDQGRIDEAIEAYRRAIKVNPKYVDAHSNLCYTLHFSDRYTPPQIYDEHARWAKQHASGISAKTAEPHDRSPDRRLRVGFVSPDFREHPVARFLWPLFEQRDRAAFEFVCYAGGELTDAVTDEYRASADAFHAVTTLSDEQLAKLIRSHAIDILVDLTGHTNNGRLVTFASRPAPVQMTYLGYPDTTGVRAINYRITDEIADPIGTDRLHAESLLRVFGSFLCYPLPRDLPAVSPLPANRNGHITFGSFNNLGKISATTMKLWSTVLAAVPDSRLIIKTTSFGDVPTRELARQRFAKQGLPVDRVELLGPERSQAAHVATYERIDIALDAYPYNGTTTTCEALSMGVPVVSLVGPNHCARVGLSLLTAVGKPEWAADSQERCVEIAASLAVDVRALAKVRAQLRQSMAVSTLCDAVGFARKIEQVFRDAWLTYVRGLQPK